MLSVPRRLRLRRQPTGLRAGRQPVRRHDQPRLVELRQRPWGVQRLVYTGVEPFEVSRCRPRRRIPIDVHAADRRGDGDEICPAIRWNASPTSAGRSTARRRSSGRSWSVRRATSPATAGRCTCSSMLRRAHHVHELQAAGHPECDPGSRCCTTSRTTRSTSFPPSANARVESGGIAPDR